MKTKIALSLILITVAFTSCDTGNNIPPDPVISETITELDAQATVTMGQFGPIYSGDYTKFSFKEGGIVDGDNWDVAFRSTHIIVNGGMVSDTSQPNRTGDAAVYITDGTMGDIISVDTSLLNQDGELSSAITNDYGIGPNGGPGIWCTYNNQIVTPNAGKILVFRTHDNKYAKVEILDFYDSAMSNIYGGFYTFNYVYQPNENTLNF